MRRYPLTFAIDRHVPPITEKQIPGRVLESDIFAAADAIVILSMLYPEDGSFALLVDSLDGRTGEEITDNELWKVWTMLANRLMRSKTLAEPKRELAEVLHGCVATALRASTAEILAAVPEGDDLGARIKSMLAVIPPEEGELRASLLAVSESFRVAMANPDVTCWNYWRTRGTDVLEAALMLRPSHPWIERVKAIWLGG